MDDEILGKLGALFDRDAENRAAEKLLEDNRRARLSLFKNGFCATRDTVIIPAAEEIAAFASGRGWSIRVDKGSGLDGEITSSGSPAVTVRVGRGTAPGSLMGPSSGNLTFKCDEGAERVRVEAGGSLIGAFRLDEITAKFVQENLAEVLAKIVQRGA
jgi:hypothetical protein